jgi:hypothetical protein
MQMMFFHFLKFIFDISTSKRSKNTKKKIEAKKNQILMKNSLKLTPKHPNILLDNISFSFFQ